MNWDQLEGKWKQYKGEVREKWGKLTDDDLHIIAGRREQLIGRLRERYGIAKDVAAREEIVASVPYCNEKVLGFRFQGVIDGRAKLSVEMKTVQDEAIFVVASHGTAETYARGVRGPVVAMGQSWRWGRGGARSLRRRWFATTAGSSTWWKPRRGRRCTASWNTWKGDAGVRSVGPSAVWPFR